MTTGEKAGVGDKLLKGVKLMCSNVATYHTKSLQLFQIIVCQRLGESKELGRAVLEDEPVRAV